MAISDYKSTFEITFVKYTLHTWTTNIVHLDTPCPPPPPELCYNNERLFRVMFFSADNKKL